MNGEYWAVDKDILFKGNKVYSPNTCCLVPKNANNLFIKSNNVKREYPIGVTKQYKNFTSRCQNPFTGKTESLGTFDTPEKAFMVYKQYKESIIKQVAQDEFNKGNITKICYDAMMNYEVEITD